MVQLEQVLPNTYCTTRFPISPGLQWPRGRTRHQQKPAALSGASLYGFAEGIAREGVPSTRLAIYKVCWSDDCSDGDILSTFDDAIVDGVDIISISVRGQTSSQTYFQDSISIGAFHSMRSGVLTSTSAGNEGPNPKTVTNFSLGHSTLRLALYTRNISLMNGLSAFPMSAKINPDAEFPYGSGHINLVKAKSPDLVYDTVEADYMAFLCAQGYSTEDLRNIIGDNSTCSSDTSISVYDLNYPSFSVSGVSSTYVSVVFRNTLTNVGSPSSTYRAIMATPNTMTIQIEPRVDL